VMMACAARDPLTGRTHVKWREDLAPHVIVGADEADELHPKGDIEELFLLACVRQIWHDIRPEDDAEAQKLKPLVGTLPAKLHRILADTGSAFVFFGEREAAVSTSTNKNFDFTCVTEPHVVFCKSWDHTCEVR